jgi:hypothetical protein
MISLPLISFLFQAYIPAYYKATKKLQASMLHDIRSPSNSLSPSLVDNINHRSEIELQHGSLCCPNPLHPVCLTTDGWSGRDHESYICLTTHWLSANWMMQDILLDVFLATDNHSGENIREWVLDNMKSNQLSVRSLTASLSVLQRIPYCPCLISV